MKKRMKSLKFNPKKSQVLWLWSILFSIISINTSQAKTVHEKKKTITKEVSVNAQTVLSVSHDFGDIRIEKYDGSIAKIVADITVRAEENVNLEEIIDKYKIDIVERKGKTEVKASFGIKSWVINSGNWFSKGKHYVEFKDGTKIDAKISDLDAQLTLYIPKISKLELDHKHHNIFGEDIDYDLKLDLFDGEYDLGDINGDFELNLKHGNGKSGNFNSANLDLFDSHINMEEGGDILLKSKHSDLKMENAKSIELDLWDSEIRMNSIESILNGKEKHSKIFIKSIGSADLELFDSRIEIDQIGGDLKVSGKHSTHEIGKVENLSSDCFDCRFHIDHLTNLSSQESKHSTYHVENLREGIFFKKGFDDHVEVENTSPTFSGLEFNGEHSTIKIDLLESIDYQVDVDVEHGSIDLIRDDLDLSKHVEKHSTLTLVGKKKGASLSSPLIKVRGKVVNVDIEK